MSTLGSLFSDGKLHHKQAPEGTLLPYGTYFKVSDVVSVFTTGYGQNNAVVQFNIHAATDALAQSIADQLATAMRTLAGNPGATLTIYGQPSAYVLPESFGIDIGEGLGPDGEDCWVAHFEAEVFYTN